MSALEVHVQVERFERTLRLRGACERFPLAILGPSGAGKTTLLECIAGLLRPRSGHVVWGGRTFVDTATGVHLPPEKRQLGYVMQEAVLFPHLCVRENVLYAARRRGLHRDRAQRAFVDTLLDELDVGHLAGRRPQAISGGERTRVALARALAARPALILLDEPFVGLDPQARDKTQQLLMRTLDRHDLPAVVVTHERDDALRYAEHAWVLLDGGIVQEGAPYDIVQRPASLDVARFVGVENVLPGETLSSAAGLCRVRCGRHEFAAHGEVARGTEVYLCVRPEDVLLSRSEVPSSARNRVAVRVEGVERQGAWRRVQLVAGSGPDRLRLSARVTAEAQSELGVEVGSELCAQFKATAAHLLVRPGSRHATPAEA